MRPPKPEIRPSPRITERVMDRDAELEAADAKARFSATAPVSDVAKTAGYTHDYSTSNGFLTLLSDGEQLNGAYALGPEAGRRR